MNLLSHSQCNYCSGQPTLRILVKVTYSRSFPQGFPAGLSIQQLPVCAERINKHARTLNKKWLWFRLTTTLLQLNLADKDPVTFSLPRFLTYHLDR